MARFHVISLFILAARGSLVSLCPSLPSHISQSHVPLCQASEISKQTADRRERERELSPHWTEGIMGDYNPLLSYPPLPPSFIVSELSKQRYLPSKTPSVFSPSILSSIKRPSWRMGGFCHGRISARVGSDISLRVSPDCSDSCRNVRSVETVTLYSSALRSH